MPEEHPPNPAMILLVQALASALKRMLPENIGFVLVIFHVHDDGVYLTSNAETQDINNVLREVVKQNEVH